VKVTFRVVDIGPVSYALHSTTIARIEGSLKPMHGLSPDDETHYGTFWIRFENGFVSVEVTLISNIAAQDLAWRRR
jgi:hypothetical protein